MWLRILLRTTHKQEPHWTVKMSRTSMFLPVDPDYSTDLFWANPTMPTLREWHNSTIHLTVSQTSTIGVKMPRIICKTSSQDWLQVKVRTLQAENSESEFLAARNRCLQWTCLWKVTTLTTTLAAKKTRILTSSMTLASMASSVSKLSTMFQTIAVFRAQTQFRMERVRLRQESVGLCTITRKASTLVTSTWPTMSRDKSMLHPSAKAATCQCSTAKVNSQLLPTTWKRPTPALLMPQFATRESVPALL